MLEEKKVHERLCSVFRTHVIKGTVYKTKSKEHINSVTAACEGMKIREKTREGLREGGGNEGRKESSAPGYSGPKTRNAGRGKSSHEMR